MRLNHGKYNRSKFNTARDGGDFIRLVWSRGVFAASNPLMKSNARLRGRTAHIRSDADMLFSVRLPISLKRACAVSRAALQMGVLRWIGLQNAAGMFAARRELFVRLFALETIALPGLVLHPGDVLVIDNDKITVEKNGVSVIEYWQTGSRPFYFLNGENIISYYDGNNARTAELTVVWRERWL
jgi:hypothetical protein